MMVAQAASGLCMTVLEGLLDTSIATEARTSVTGALARGTAGRALGSAIAVATLPIPIGQVGLTTTMSVVAGLLVGGVLVARRRGPQRGEPQGSLELKPAPPSA